MVKWQTEWQNSGNGGRNGQMVGMVEWWEWKTGMVKWQTEMATYVLFTVHTDTDDDDDDNDDDNNTLIFYSIDSDLLTFFNLRFPLPNQQSWTVFCPSYETDMGVISVLRMRHSILEDWW
jgi:hypothetical protein